MNVVFDAAKDTENRRKHGVSLAEAAFMDWDAALIWQDTRHDYGETRMVALGEIGERVYCAVFVDRESDRRVISLRKANQREFDHYEQETN
ncbi:MAG: hypothetical protein A3G18_00375 [Rhodospirillales bacterium RIFCSPLOWO2_12_FULL_58_28]|nr:MAG: hypothetical protein A3H92_02980 [Rhodospirillales bacterium RIFCSPLOWO2_02_FULL_58_16]OHC79920.1 MAG: hypothetical protein A3G18_00375 [Rhodospirillales bacterium RIFCSPLOWO2_12_FULL_58_28]